MKVLLTRKTIFIAAIVTIIAIVTFVSINVFSSSGPVTGIANAVTRPIRTMATVVVRTFERIYSSIYSYDDLQERYDRLARDFAVLQRAQSESHDLLLDNNRLRALLGFRERHAGYVLEEAVISDWTSNNFTSTFEISKGYANSVTSIAPGNSVMTEHGVLIGQITEVGATTSIAITVLDTTFSAGAFVGDSGGAATVKGDFSLMNSGLIILDHISDDLVVLPGDSVVTSSSGGVFPNGLVIGEVVEVLRHSTGVGRYAIVNPMRAIDQTITNVNVITSFDITG